VSAAGSLVQAAGAAWLLPAGLVAGGAAAATLVIGLSGVGDALKALSKADDAAATTATASGKARTAAAESVRSAQDALASAQRNADRTSIQGAQQVADARRALADAQISGARQVAAAQQDLTRAQEQARAAQQDLTRAWKEGQEQLEDFALTLRGAALDEEDAVDRLEEARARLESARRGGAGAEEIDDLDRAVRRAELGVDQAAERMGDLREEQQEWARTGVAGSDAVVSAQRRVADSAQGVRDAEIGLFHARQDQRKQVEDAQRSLSQAVQQAGWAQADATRQVTDAQRQLAAAMAATGAVGGAAAATAAAEMAKLSPAAQALVGSIRSLGPAWTALRLDVQERLLAGIGDRVLALAGSYLPILRTSLGGIATGFNDAFKQTSGFLETPRTVNDIALGMNNVTLGVNNASGAMRPLTQLFVDLFAVGSTFLPAMGQGIADVTQRWADFIARARETGQLRLWIQQGIDVLRQLGSIAGNVGSILFSSFRSANASGESFLSMLDRVTERAAVALNTPAGASGLTEFFVTVRTVTGVFVDKLVQLWPALVAAGGAIAALLVAASPLSSVIFSLVVAGVVPLLHAVEFLAPVLGPMVVLFGAWRIALALGTAAMVAWRFATGLATAVSVAYQLAMGTSLALTNAQSIAQARFTFVRYAGVAATYAMTAAQWLFNSSLIPTIASMFMMTLRTIAFVSIMGAYYTVIGLVRVATLLWTGVQWLLNAALLANPIGVVLVLVAALVGGFIWAWKNSETFRDIIMGVWAGIKIAFFLGWAVVKGVFDFMVGGLRMVGGFFVWVWQTLIKPTWDAFQIGIAIGGAAIGLTFTVIQFALETLRGWFWRIVDGIGDKWNELRGKLARPINFMIETVFNNGILRAWNKVREWLPGLPEVHRIAPIAEFALGGPVRGAGTPTSDSIVAKVSRDEHIWTAREVRGAGGHEQVQGMRDAARRGTLAYYRDGGPVIPGFAGGGAIYEHLFGLVRGRFPQASLNSGFRAGDPGQHGKGKAVDLGQRGRAGGRGHAYLADMNRWIHDTHGKGTRALIYSGAGDDRPDLLGGRPHNFGAATNAGHKDHVHWDVNSIGDLRGGGILGAIGGAVDFLSTFFRDAVGGAFRGITDPLLNLLPKPPPQFAGIPREQFTKIRDTALAFVLGKADEKDREAGAGGVGMGPLGKGAAFYVKEIVRAGSASGVGRPGNVIGVATALVESGLKMYANRTVPASLGFPHDAVGSDHDSVGLFQQRQAGWGTLAQRMNPFASAQLFFNALNRFNWRGMAPGPAAQRVQRSAFPGRYAGQMGRAGQLVDLHADNGGFMPPGFGTYFNGTGKMEAVLTDEQWRSVRDRTTGGDGVTQNFYIEETTNPESTARKIARRQAFDSRLR